MRKNLFLLIVLINSAALLGIFSTQVYWIREAYNLLDDQFSGSVRIALKGVANQMLNDELKKYEETSIPGTANALVDPPDIRHINPGLLELKINEEFGNMHVGQGFDYAIIDLKDTSFVIGKYEGHNRDLLTSQHQIPLTGFKDSDNYVLSAFFPGQASLILHKLVDWIIISVIFAIILVIGFPISLFIFNRQKRVSDMKSDFINNMTHEFKTPIATISLASEMLMKQNIQEDPARTRRYARIIYDENTRLQNHVEQVLSVSLLERGQFSLKKREINVHDVISEAVENFSITIKERDGEIKTHFCATNFMIYADREHLTNVITNLLDNANKYSTGKPWIRIGTQSTDDGLIITVEDRGIGISLENQQLIFRKLYRVPTGNLYNVKGFGIGLYYVKTIVEAHGGHIILKSELNKGSRFDVYLPYNIFKSSKKDEYDQT